jgi:hypothetical protein
MAAARRRSSDLLGVLNRPGLAHLRTVATLIRVQANGGAPYSLFRSFIMIKPTPNPPRHLFTVNPHQDTEALLVNASETLSSLNAMTCNLAFDLDTSQRAIMLGIQQMAELGQLLVDRALEQIAPSSGA